MAAIAHSSVLLRYFKKYKLLLTISVAFAILMNYTNLLIPQSIQSLVNDYILVNNYNLWPLFTQLMWIFVFSGIFSLIRELANQTIGANIIYEMRNDIYHALQTQSFSFYDQNRTGNLMSKATSDVHAVQLFLSTQFSQFIKSVVTLGVILFFVFSMNWILALVFFGLTPPIFILMVWFRRKIRPTAHASRESWGMLNSVLQENVTGYKVVRSFAREEYERKKFHKNSEEFFDKSMKVVRLHSIFGPATELISSGGAILLIFLGAILVFFGYMNLGEVVSFYVYYSFLYDPIKFIVHFFSQFSETMAAADRVSDLLSGKSDIVEKPPAKSQSMDKRLVALEENFPELVTPESKQLILTGEERVHRLQQLCPTVQVTPDMNHEAIVSALEKGISKRKYSIRVDPRSFTGEVEFHNVGFTYKDSERPILKHINFKVRPGDTIAFLGSTGSGKSTIINLIPRFYDVTEGEILVDGIDLRDYELSSYRKQVGIVAQETFLFSRSIKDNIAYGRKGVKRRDIIKVAKIANIHDFVMTLPKKYNTIVGERGVTLSGGQKQRVAIARALLIRPKILILDDSTSSVDVDTEYEIQKALRNLFKETTTFIITQRISTVRDASRIFILDDGEIVEEGTHEELLTNGGIYTRIYNTLFRTQSHKIPMKLVVEGDKLAVRRDHQYGDRVAAGADKTSDTDSIELEGNKKKQLMKSGSEQQPTKEGSHDA